ncbi:MAG: 3-deoxy-8-phosphooctulonate synthase [Phycisphaerae bacterium]|nr:3-deoxy-8-phosphooctulonate synthase [Phycisphaerae bacterium]
MNALPKLTLPQGQIGPYPIGGPDARMVVVAGPCVIESLDHCLTVAGRVGEICKAIDLPCFFKASFDKANRSSIDSYRGPGLEKGLEILAEVKRRTGLPIVTDIHTPDQAAPAAQTVDVLQIPAFLARQTDLLVAAAQTGRCVNVKKAQFMAPWDMENVRDKLRSANAPHVVFTERGVFFGYNRWVVDFRAIEWMHQLGIPVLMDATHAAADPGGMGKASGGQRDMGALLARAGVAAGADGLFLEVHDNPEKAKSDAATVLPLDWLPELLEQCLKIYQTVRK